MAANVGEAVAYLKLDTSEFKKALNGAGKDLEIFVHKVEEEKTKIEKLQEALTKKAETFSNIGKSFEKPSAAAQNLLKTGMKNNLEEEAKSNNPKKGPANIAKNNYNKIQKDIQDSIKKVQDSFAQLQASIVKQLIPIFNNQLVPILNNKLIPIFKKVSNKVIELMNSFNKLPNPVKNAIAVMIVSIAGVAKTFTVLGKVVSTINNVIGVFGKLKKAAGVFSVLRTLITPHTLIIVAAIAAIGFIVYEVIKHWDTLKKYATQFGKFIGNVFKGIGKVINSIIQGAIHAFQGFIKVLQWVGGMVQNIINGCIAIFRGVGTILHVVVQGWIIIFKGLGNLAGTLFNIGKNIVEGLINGIKSMFGHVGSVIGNLASKIADGFKSFLGINSPSRVFSNYGKSLGEGLIQGIDNQQSAVDTKIKGMADKIKGLGNVKPNFNGLNNMALSGVYGGTYGLSNVSHRNSKQLNFTPNITMNIAVTDTGKKGTVQLTNELKEMAKTSLKNSMIDEFMNDALRL
ncbi:hypothetical protein NPD7_39 [Clostridium sporogenes]|uniref:hypothetical protein n=1 Tax=Clostridium TaxID=1485 RepID=UPI00090BD642|nr:MULTISPECIES: hypothetical protein [Clostridium]APF26506.1 hypothetical protein NPD7_39 [Clostridium sporogenes]MDI6918844.1 hypothetical protein [Clostridium botulinum]WMU97085.1 hypothetical protein QA656_15110 [Clostridium botulinum]